ncbi:MAG: hydrogenase nickel incorporation protein HypB, partial [Dehalococcoidia bacterium]|nr:hydrogenase nickel incorporation protein HypB [Dehalococcoidia bacterium]
TAESNRATLDNHSCAAINVMAAPGAGKTSFILRTLDLLRPDIRVGVIEGDVASTVDAEKVQNAADAVVQINTRNMPESCALVADMVDEALKKLPLAELDLIIIENVGNLICPTEFNLGEDRKIVIASTPEGDDKPLKYPMIFTDADAIIINKIDLIPYVDFDIDKFKSSVRQMNSSVPFFEVSCKTGAGMAEWIQWLRQQLQGK